MQKCQLGITLLTVLTMSCATVSQKSTIRKTPIRSWTETEQGKPSVRLVSSASNSNQISGQVEEFSVCQKVAKVEHQRVSVEVRKPKKLWLEMLVGAAVTGLGSYLLATADTRSSEPGTNDAGDDTMSPRQSSYLFGGIAAGTGGILLGHGTVQAIRSIDRETEMNNAIEEEHRLDPYDCAVTKIGAVRVKVWSADLGILEPVPVADADSEGNFAFDLTQAEGFTYPAEIKEIAAELRSETGRTELTVGDWVFQPLEDARRSCREFSPCAKKYDELKRDKSGRFVKVLSIVRSRLIALAQDSEALCRKFEKRFSGSGEFGNMDDISDVCDFFAVKRQNSIETVRQFLTKQRSQRIESASEKLSFDLISKRPRVEDCRWFEKRFPQSPYLESIRDFAMSLEYDGVPADLLKCCAGDSLKIIDVLQNEKKGWSESLAIESVMQSSSSFKVFIAEEIEHLRRAGMREVVIQAMMKKHGMAKKEALVFQQNAARAEGDIKRCIVACKRDFGECADRRGRDVADAWIWDSTGCDNAYKECFDACQ